jgi:hypothetical protein
MGIVADDVDGHAGALVFGYTFVIAIGLSSFVLIENLIGNYDETDPSVRFGISVFPPFALYRGLLYITAEG